MFVGVKLVFVGISVLAHTVRQCGFQAKAENEQHILTNRKLLKITKSSPKPSLLTQGALTWGKGVKRKGVQRENH